MLSEMQDNLRLNREETMRSVECASTPVVLRLALTSACNLRCIMCYDKKQEKTLPESSLRKLWPFLPAAGSVFWLGGEVFMAPYFKVLLGEMGAAFPHLEHTIVTNGLLIDDPMAAVLSGCNARLHFSIDSARRETYESIRVGARFGDLHKKLELAAGRYEAQGRQKFHLNAIVMKRTMRDLELFPSFCEKYRFGTLHLMLLGGLKEENIFRDKDPSLVRELAGIVGNVERECRGRGIEFHCLFENLLKENERAHKGGGQPGASPRAVRCNQPWKSLFINFDGTVKPACECVAPAGSLITDDPAVVWNGKGMKSYRARMREGKLRGLCSAACLSGALPWDYRCPEL
ncbi:MAG: radical SAM protein [Endomicrobiales bacterium]